MSLVIKNLHVSVGTKEIIKDLSLELPKGKIIALMGPNGSGKSTFANALLGHPKFTVTKGKIILDKKDITILSPDKRAKLGLFLSQQYSPEIPGVTIANFLRLAVAQKEAKNINPLDFHKAMTAKMSELSINPDFAKRYVNTGFSGGEKKKAEILQLLLLNPTYAILDETDSGLDVDALKVVAKGINKFKNKDRGVLIITHYNRILEYVRPDIVHVMMEGRIVKSGGAELAKKIEKEGYSSMKAE